MTDTRIVDAPSAATEGPDTSGDSAAATPANPFHDLDAYVAVPRLEGLVLSPDGTRLVTGVSTLDPQQVRYVSALWEIDPTGARPARRLTRSAKGERGTAFLPDGSVLFRSTRPDPGRADPDPDAPPALWVLPPGGGEAALLASRPGGIREVAVAADAGTVVVVSPTMPAAVSADDDERRRAERKERKIGAILHESYPVRYWDSDLGPEQPRLLAVVPAAGGGERGELRDLTPAPGRALDEVEFDVTPDGRTVITTWLVPERGGRRKGLAAVDVATGERRMLLDDPAWEYSGPRVSPDGSTVALRRFRRPTATGIALSTLALLDLATGTLRGLAEDWPGWPGRPVWTPDGASLLVSADLDGAAPVFRISVATGAVQRLTPDRGAYSDLQVCPDGGWAYALRSAVDCPPLPVRLRLTATGDGDGTDVGSAEVELLPAPASAPEVPGRLTEVTTTAADGTPLRAWLALPAGAGAADPAPLLLWIHGGPLSSWNAWSWRWNPWLAVARGYAVLLPDPALSTGYGEEFIRRGWGAWGGTPYTDLMTVTDVTVARDDIDEGRTAAMGGSFGGYMANWVAGHTDRFRGIVSHAGLWALDQFGPTTDAYDYWRREVTAEMVSANSPHRFVDEIRTPMLVIHGDRDYRVPVGEAIRLWAELAERASAEDGTMPHKFLYFPDEHHWVLSPQHAKVWYSTVFAFLAHTVRGEAWVVPDVLR